MGTRRRPAREPRPAEAGVRLREHGIETWPDGVRIMEKHNGVWGGCWCVAFHAKPDRANQTAASNRAYKERLVRANNAHAALVYDGPDVVGWCQFGPPVELPARMGGFRKIGCGSSRLEDHVLLRRPQSEKAGSCRSRARRRTSPDRRQRRWGGRWLSNRHARETVLELIPVRRN